MPRAALLLGIPASLLLLASPGHTPPGEAPGWLEPAAFSASRFASSAAPLRVPSTPRRDPVQFQLEERLRDAWREQRRGARVVLEGRRIAPSATTLALLESTGAFGARGRAFRSADGTLRRRARLHKRGRPIFNRPVLLEEHGGRLVRMQGQSRLPRVDTTTPVLGSRAALDEALAHLGAQELRGLPRVERGWLAAAAETLPVYRVVAPAMRPFGSFLIDVDARSGRVLSMVDLVRSADGQGRVFDPNLIEDPLGSLVPLFDLDDSGTLAGDFTRVFDTQEVEAFVPSLDFVFDPVDPRFVQTSVYRGLTDAGRLATAHGFPGFPAPVVAFTNLRDPSDGVSEFNNAFYDPVFQLFGFGNGDGSLTANLGTDLDVAAHEMAHHIFQELVDPEFGSLGAELLEINEGVADTWAALVAGDPDIGESTIPGSPFLRSVDNDASFLDPFDPDPHIRGLIIAGANWDIIERIGAAEFTDVLLDALSRLTADGGPAGYEEAILAANLAVRAGADQAAIEQVFRDRAFEVTEPSEDFEGVLDDGVTESRLLPDSPFDPDPATWNVDFWGFAEFPGSTQVHIETSGSGDVDLFVAALDLDVMEAAFSGTTGTSNETVVLTPGSELSVDADDRWFIAVTDFPDGSSSSYQITASATLPPSQVQIGGPPLVDALDEIGEADFFTFETTQPSQVVRAEVTATGGLDPIVVVFDPVSVVALDGDDDSGPGVDAFLAGVLVPTPGTWGVAVIAFAGDVDPGSAVGGYELRLSSCNNTVGPNADGDELVDACDPDDDGDGFRDPRDSAPLDPALCADLDEDACDDCDSGLFDPFADGLDSDSDGLCDSGDRDDDNDGCIDEADPEPLLASTDVDFDFLGADCDNCRQVSNPDQADFDAGLDDDTSLPGVQHYGDACDVDLDDDGVVGPSDFFGGFRPCLGADLAARAECTEADLDGDGGVAASDFFTRLRPAFGRAPGPGLTE